MEILKSEREKYVVVLQFHFKIKPRNLTIWHLYLQVKPEGEAL
jgi:hypothetical protein